EHRRAPRDVTVAVGFCFQCHDEVLERRASHRGFAPSSCQTGGCHNYHDDRGLNSAFLGKQLGQTDTHSPTIPLSWGRAAAAGTTTAPAAIPASLAGNAQIERLWGASAHAGAAVGCADCHNDPAGAPVARPTTAVCAGCHDREM